MGRNIVGKVFKTSDMYKEFKEEHEILSIMYNVDYKLFRSVICRFNKLIIQEILRGYNFKLPYFLGSIFILRVERNFGNNKIDWGKTNELKKKGINRHVYFTSEWWCRWYWEKYSCKARNRTVYSFKPTRNSKKREGSQFELVNLLKSDSVAYLNFRWFDKKTKTIKGHDI